MANAAPLHLPIVPEAFLATLAGISRKRFGKAAPEGPILAAAVQEVSRRYTRDRAALMDSQGEPASLTARLRYYLPRDLYKVWGPLSELHRAGCLPQKKCLRVLDVGAGLGTTSLGLATFAAHHGLCDSLELTAIDSDPAALELLTSLLAQPSGLVATPMQVKTERKRLDASTRLPPGPFDFILCGLALNEFVLPLPEAEQVGAGVTFLKSLTKRLGNDGALIVLEPALRTEARRLQHMRQELCEEDAAPFIFAPCLGTAPCPMLDRKRDWCHERLPARFPEQLGELSRKAGLRDEELTYSYLTLRRTKGNLTSLSRSGHPFRIVGGPVVSKGKVEFSLCGPARSKRLVRLDRHLPADDPLEGARRGTILSLSGPSVDDDEQTLRMTHDVQADKVLTWEAQAKNTDDGAK